MVGVIIFAIYEIWGLIKLAPVQRWLCVGLLALWTCKMVVHLIIVGNPRVIPIIAIPVGINLAVIYYLGRPSFGRVCDDFKKARSKPFVF